MANIIKELSKKAQPNERTRVEEDVIYQLETRSEASQAPQQENKEEEH